MEKQAKVKKVSVTHTTNSVVKNYNHTIHSVGDWHLFRQLPRFY